MDTDPLSACATGWEFVDSGETAGAVEEAPGLLANASIVFLSALAASCAALDSIAVTSCAADDDLTPPSETSARAAATCSMPAFAGLRVAFTPIGAVVAAALPDPAGLTAAATAAPARLVVDFSDGSRSVAALVIDPVASGDVFRAEVAVTRDEVGAGEVSTSGLVAFMDALPTAPEVCDDFSAPVFVTSVFVIFAPLSLALLPLAVMASLESRSTCLSSSLPL